MTRAEPVTGYQRTYSGRAEQVRKHNDRPHGLDIVEALTGADGWDTETTSDGGRVVWALLSWPVGL